MKIGVKSDLTNSLLLFVLVSVGNTTLSFNLLLRVLVKMRSVNIYLARSSVLWETGIRMEELEIYLYDSLVMENMFLSS